MRLVVKEVGMLLKRLLTSSETIVCFVILCSDSFVRNWKVSGILVGCCRKSFKEWNSQRAHSWLNKLEEERMGLREIPGL